MSAQRALTEESKAQLKAALGKARSKDEFRRALCVWLRVGLGPTARRWPSPSWPPFPWRTEDSSPRAEAPWTRLVQRLLSQTRHCDS